MDFKELRKQSGMNKTEFAQYFNIPYRTIMHWEQGTRKCPDYVLELIKYKLDNEYPKREYIKINDFSHEEIHRTLCEKYGDQFIKLNEIEHAINDGTIEICEDRIIIH